MQVTVSAIGTVLFQSIQAALNVESGEQLQIYTALTCLCGAIMVAMTSFFELRYNLADHADSQMNACRKRALTQKMLMRSAEVVSNAPL